MSDYPERKSDIRYAKLKAAAGNAVCWLNSDLDLAKAQGARVVTVKIQDLQDLVQYVKSQVARDDIEFSGHRFGYARPADLHAMLKGEGQGLMVRRGRTPKYPIEVFCRETVTSANLAPEVEDVSEVQIPETAQV